MNEGIFARAYKPGVSWEIPVIYFTVLKIWLPHMFCSFFLTCILRRQYFPLYHIIFTLSNKLVIINIHFYFCKVILSFADNAASPR